MWLEATTFHQLVGKYFSISTSVFVTGSDQLNFSPAQVASLAGRGPLGEQGFDPRRCNLWDFQAGTGWDVDISSVSRARGACTTPCNAAPMKESPRG